MYASRLHKTNNMWQKFTAICSLRAIGHPCDAHPRTPKQKFINGFRKRSVAHLTHTAPLTKCFLNCLNYMVVVSLFPCPRPVANPHDPSKAAQVDVCVCVCVCGGGSAEGRSDDYTDPWLNFAEISCCCCRQSVLCRGEVQMAWSILPFSHSLVWTSISWLHIIRFTVIVTPWFCTYLFGVNMSVLWTVGVFRFLYKHFYCCNISVIELPQENEPLRCESH